MNAWQLDDLVRREILAIGWNRQTIKISRREALGGNGGTNECEPSDPADGWRRLIYRSYQEKYDQKIMSRWISGRQLQWLSGRKDAWGFNRWEQWF